MHNGNARGEEARQKALKAWLAKALDLGERFCALYTLAPSDYAVGAPIASRLLSRMAVTVLRNSASFSDIEQRVEVGEPGQEPGFVMGVHLGSYTVERADHSVFLVSVHSFGEPPRASAPTVESSIFLEPLPPAPPLALARLAAVHLGLCRLLARVSRDLAPAAEAGSVFTASRPHPLAERARALARWVEQQRAATPADWDALLRERAAAQEPREPAAAAEALPTKGGRGLPKRLLDPPRKQPLREIWHRIGRCLAGRYNSLGYPFLVRPKQVLVVERRTRTVLCRRPLDLACIMRPGHELRAKSGCAYQPAAALFVDPDAVVELAERILREMIELRPDCAGARP